MLNLRSRIQRRISFTEGVPRVQHGTGNPRCSRWSRQHHHFTHCATRLRFELRDASVIDKDTVEAIDGVLGAVPQSGDRYQIVIGGAVQSVFNEINNLPR